MMLVVAVRPRSSSALRNCARLLSAFLMPANEAGPLMPGVMLLRLSPVLCWLPSGSRDQNTSTNGFVCSGGVCLAGVAGLQFQCPLAQGCLYLFPQRHAVLAAGGIVDHDRMQA